MNLSKPQIIHQAATIEDNAELIAGLARTGSIKLTDQGRGLKLKSVKQNVWLDISDEVLASYAKQLKTRQQEQTNLIANFEARLSNKSYVDHAPKKIVDETKQSLIDAKAVLATLDDELNRLD